MHLKNRYAKMVFYIEACESGSMFPHLSSELKVFATTAANATTSSYACYFDQGLGTYLGDVYSVKWLEGNKPSVRTFERLAFIFMRLPFLRFR